MGTRDWKSPSPPWVSTATAQAGEREAAGALAAADVRVVRLHGERMTEKLRLLDAFAEAFDFYVPWGRNWDAFEEMMFNSIVLSGIPVLVAISGAERLLASDAERDKNLTIFLDILRYLGAELARPQPRTPQGISLHVILSKAQDAAIPAPLVSLPELHEVEPPGACDGWSKG